MTYLWYNYETLEFLMISSRPWNTLVTKLTTQSWIMREIEIVSFMSESVLLLVLCTISSTKLAVMWARNEYYINSPSFRLETF